MSRMSWQASRVPPGPHAGAPMPRRRAVTLATCVALYAAAALWLNLAIGGPFKILTYATPFFALMAVLSEARFTLPDNAAPYLVLMIAGIGLAPLNSLTGWQDLYLMLMGLSPFFFGYRYKWSWMQIFVATVIATVLNVALVHGRGGGGVEFNPLESKSTFESSTSFVFGLLVIWAAAERRWRHALLALLLCVLTLKRIIVLASLVTIIVMLLPRGLTSRVLRPLPMILLNALFLLIVVLYTKGQLDQLITGWTHQSANQLGMGRQALYRQPVEELLRHPVQYIFYGVGPGGIYDVIKRGFAYFGKPNLHNDSLKILVEYGGIVWVAFFGILYRNQPIERRCVMLFLNIVLLTDNSLIYPFFIFSMGLVLQNLNPPPVPVPASTAAASRAALRRRGVFEPPLTEPAAPPSAAGLSRRQRMLARGRVPRSPGQAT